MSDKDMIIIGRVSGLFGVRGWVKIYSFTSPKEGILSYKTWCLKRQGEWQEFKVAAGHPQGKGIVAQIEGYDDRDRSVELVESEIAIRRTELPALPAGEYYWTDLEGLLVSTLNGIELGKVSHLFETGANDVLVVKGDRERLIPYIVGQAVQEIDLEAGRMIVDWDPDF
ncbi:MAG: ribosome maturation factor RimM [Candidatus Thiodiazotropha sp. DIVDIV]